MTESALPATERAPRYPALIAGPLLAAVVYWLLPDAYIALDGSETPIAHETRATIALIAWMATWWFTEAVHLAVTALLPLALFPLFGVAGIEVVASSYASHLIFLFVGGFIIGLAIHRWRLDKRIALLVLLVVGERPANVVGGFMLVAAFLSAFVSNTATTIMLLPIALSVLGLRDAEGGEADSLIAGDDRFAVCLMLAIAYAASIGGISTLIGTAPNVFAATFIHDSLVPGLGADISFVGWLKMALPAVLVLLPVCWLLLTHVVFPLGERLPGARRQALIAHYRELGTVSRGEWLTLAVFAFAATLWITRPLIGSFEITIGGVAYAPFAGLSDAGIAIFAALLLFVLPAGDGRAVMDWRTAVQLPWGIVLLLGGGLALAAAVKSHEVDLLLGAQATAFSQLPDFAALLLVVALIVFLTEFASNTATTAALVPMLAAFAPVFDIHPMLLIIPATFAASCAFMMPVATPPNAIVFGSGRLHVSQMVKAGFWINLAAIAVVTLVGYFWVSRFIQ